MAVFIPVLFMGGIVGRLLHEFSVTIMVAILISGFVSLTLRRCSAAASCSRSRAEARLSSIALWKRGFNRLARGYDYTLRMALRFRFADAGGRGARCWSARSTCS